MEIQEAFLRCPLSSKIFYDPVISVDGETYEKEFIKKHHEDNHFSPIHKEINLGNGWNGEIVSFKNKVMNRLILNYIETNPLKIT